MTYVCFLASSVVSARKKTVYFFLPISLAHDRRSYHKESTHHQKWWLCSDVEEANGDFFFHFWKHYSWQASCVNILKATHQMSDFFVSARWNKHRLLLEEHLHLASTEQPRPTLFHTLYFRSKFFSIQFFVFFCDILKCVNLLLMSKFNVRSVCFFWKKTA